MYVYDDSLSRVGIAHRDHALYCMRRECRGEEANAQENWLLRLSSGLRPKIEQTESSKTEDRSCLRQDRPTRYVRRLA